MKYVVVSVPTERTIKRLNDIFMSSPFSIDFTQLYIPLWIGEVAPRNYVQRGPYSSKFSAFRTNMSPSHDSLELVGFLTDEKLKQRSIELGSPEDFDIRLIFLNHAPPSSRTTRSFVVSISDTLVTRESEPFTFTTELLLQI